MKSEGIIKRLLKRWFLDALSAMALGLFASLLIGTIFMQLGKWTNFEFFKVVAKYAMDANVVGAAIGAAVAYGLKVKPLAIFTAAVTGAIGYAGGSGGPLGAYVAALVGAEISNLIAGKTKVDILLVPAAALLTGGAVGYLLGPVLGGFMVGLGTALGHATQFQPVLMGIVMAVSMGIILTAPISSAAIAAMIFTQGNINEQGVALAAGAATVGCCCQMVGFAISSWRENKFGGFVAQGIGTSMLQVPNILQHPLVLIPPTLASAVLGPISTTLLVITNIEGTYAGMGTCGIVGPIGVWTSMAGAGSELFVLLKIVLMCFVLPALLSLAISETMRKLGWIKHGQMKLEL